MAGAEHDLWQQGGNALLSITLYISPKARDRAFELDRRTVYRRKEQTLEQVAVFKTAEDAASVVKDHNYFVTERAFQHLHRRIDHLIERVESDTMGDPVI